MGRILVHEFISLDGVYENPSWTFEFPFEPTGEAISGFMGGAEAILLGRRTYEMFEPAWSTRTAADDPGAPFFNESPKHVVSSTLKDPTWSNSHVVGPYTQRAIRELKGSVDGDIYVSGSGTLVRALLADGLVDELHLFVFPVALGSGERLFPDGGPKTKLELKGADGLANGVVHLTYGQES